MELRIVVESNLIGGVLVAEDVAAMAAMVSTFEKVEGSMASGRVADRGVSVRFPVLAGGHPFNGEEVLIIYESSFILSDLPQWALFLDRGG